MEIWLRYLLEFLVISTLIFSDSQIRMVTQMLRNFKPTFYILFGWETIENFATDWVIFGIGLLYAYKVTGCFVCVLLLLFSVKLVKIREIKWMECLNIVNKISVFILPTCLVWCISFWGVLKSSSPCQKCKHGDNNGDLTASQVTSLTWQS